MSILPLSASLSGRFRLRGLAAAPRLPLQRPSLDVLARLDPQRLPPLIRQSALAMRYLRLLGPLDWSHFPEPGAAHFWRDEQPFPLACLAAACLVKLDQRLAHMPDLHTFLLEHPELLWLLGFPLVAAPRLPWGFEPQASLPTHRHLSRLLRQAPNAAFQHLLASSVACLQQELAARAPDFGKQVSLDTKHILAWVKENNPKAYVGGPRFDKHQQPKGDPDCKVGCKRKSNQRRKQPENAVGAASGETPTTEAHPGSETLSRGEYYWGYASGVVACQIPGWGEFALAELTQTFDKSDVSYFFPLMNQVQQRLGFKPPFGALDAAYDSFYVYDYFHQAGGFAAVPFVEKGGYKEKGRQFSPEGLPLCEAGLAMPIKFTFIDRQRALIEHERGKHVCPLIFPQPTGSVCPVEHKNWPRGGCTADMPTSIGARLRYQIDRDSPAYKDLYRQRTAVERLYSQAKELGIERPHLRNRHSITNHNTLIYVLINLRALQRILQRDATPR